MAGNSQRKGAIRKTAKKPAAGSGGRVKRGLEGKGPTPKAKDRPYHKAHKAQTRAQKDQATRPKRRTTKSSDAEWVAGRNSVVEALRAGVPVNGLYVAEGAERDGRLREAFRLASEGGISLLEVSRTELDRMTGGAVHQGLAARIPAYEYAHPDDFLDVRGGHRRAGAHRRARLGDRPAQPRRRDPLGRRLRRARRRRPRAPGRRHDGLGVEDLGRRSRPHPGRAGGQPGPPAQGLPGRRLLRRSASPPTVTPRCPTRSPAGGPTGRSSSSSAPRARASRASSPTPATSSSRSRCRARSSRSTPASPRRWRCTPSPRRARRSHLPGSRPGLRAASLPWTDA